MIPVFPVYLFDLDGTLLDSAEDICGAIQRILSETNCRPVSHDYLKSFIGFHLDKLFLDLFPDCTRDRLDELILRYRTEYPARDHRSTRVFPGVNQALAALGGLKSTATTKGTPTTKLVLERFALAQYFDHVQGTDGFPCKPEPDVIRAALEKLGAKPCDALMIGDTSADIEAGKRAGVKTCAVRYGYGDPAELTESEPDYWIDDLRELLGATPPNKPR